MPERYIGSESINEVLNEIKDSEHWQGNTFPRVYTQVRVGDKLLKSHSVTGNSVNYLQIDSNKIVKDIPDLPGGLRHIRDLFDQEAGEETYISSGGIATLSDLISQRKGDCLEMAAVVQLKAQDEGRESYLFSGTIYGGNMEFSEDHSFNIVKGSKGDYILVDVAGDFTSKINALVLTGERDLVIVTERESDVNYCIN